MFKSMKRIIRWAGKYKGRLYLGSVRSFFSSLLTAIPTMAAAFALDKAVQAYWTNTAIDTVLIWQMLGIIIGSITLNFLLSYLRAILQESIGYEVAAGQRIHLGDVLKRAPFGYFSQNSVGDILAGVTTELSTLELQGMKMVELRTGRSGCRRWERAEPHPAPERPESRYSASFICSFTA